MNAVKLMMLAGILSHDSCDSTKSSDEVQSSQQERILQEATAAVGMPAIKNFRERRLLKDILELRDQNDLNTYTYLFSEVSGKLTFICDSIGYSIPYATQFTNPQKLESGHGGTCGYYTLPQADPNGLFSPSSADGTWVMCRDPRDNVVRPQFVEPKVVTLTFRAPTM